MNRTNRSDRLPLQIDPKAFYLNMDPSGAARDPDDAPAGSMVTIIFDGDVDELADLIGKCFALDYEILVINLRSFEHLAKDHVLGIPLEMAYEERGRLWEPTDDLLNTLRELVRNNMNASVIAE